VEINNIRKGGSSKQSGLSNADKVLIHMRYLITSRFEDAYDVVLKLIQVFIEKVGDVLPEVGELLNAVANLKVSYNIYDTWESCIGTFMS